MIHFLFKAPDHKRFEFKPRFYDENREDLENRKAAIHREMNPNQASSSDIMRHRIDRAWVANHKRQDGLRSNRNIFIIAAILAIVAYYFLK